MPRVLLFVVSCIMGGVGGLVGSMVGGVFDNIFLGGFLGGVAIAPLSAGIAKWRGWITSSQYLSVTIGAALGFLVAATIAVNTMSSPVGPILSTALVGLGALLGQWVKRS